MAPEWEEIFNQKDEPTKDVFCYMGEQHFSLFLLHFSWYTICGEGVQARNFCVTAYHTRSHQENEDFKVRVYFIPIIPNSSVGQQVIFILFSNYFMLISAYKMNPIQTPTLTLTVTIPIIYRMNQLCCASCQWSCPSFSGYCGLYSLSQINTSK